MSGSTVRITPPLFRERLFHINCLGQAVNMVCYYLKRHLYRLPYAEREFQYVQNMLEELLYVYKYLCIQATHRLHKTKKVQELEFRALLLIAKLEDYFMKNPL